MEYENATVEEFVLLIEKDEESVVVELVEVVDLDSTFDKDKNTFDYYNKDNIGQNIVDKNTWVEIGKFGHQKVVVGVEEVAAVEAEVETVVEVEVVVEIGVVVEVEAEAEVETVVEVVVEAEVVGDNNKEKWTY